MNINIFNHYINIFDEINDKIKNKKIIDISFDTIDEMTFIVNELKSNTHKLNSNMYQEYVKREKILDNIKKEKLLGKNYNQIVNFDNNINNNDNNNINEILEDGNDKLQKSLSILKDIEKIGDNTLQKTKQQGEQINNINEKVGNINTSLHNSNKTLSKIVKTEQCIII